MSLPAFESLDPALAHALADHGFTALTAVQEAVLDPEAEGRDLRVTSQTGSGKTVAIGLALRDAILGAAQDAGAVAKPVAILAKMSVPVTRMDGTTVSEYAPNNPAWVGIFDSFWVDVRSQSQVPGDTTPIRVSQGVQW